MPTNKSVLKKHWVTVFNLVTSRHSSESILHMAALYLLCSFPHTHFSLCVQKSHVYYPHPSNVALLCKIISREPFHCVIIIDSTTSCFSHQNTLKAAAAATNLQVISFGFRDQLPIWEIKSRKEMWASHSDLLKELKRVRKRSLIQD